ncbi:MAG: ribosome maturation factor RimP [Gaiellaceae bacterium]
MTNVYDKEKTLFREIAPQVETAIPGVEVLALELSGPERFTVYIDHPQRVDHDLCARVTDVLRSYLREYTVDVSSPGVQRPLRTPAHFERAVGRQVSLRTSEDIEGRKRFKGQVVGTNPAGIRVATDGAEYEIPYETIVRGNLIEESVR